MRAYIAMGKYVGLFENSYFAFLRSCNVRFSTFWWIPLILDLTMGLSRVEEVGKHKTYICEWKGRHLNIGLKDNSLLCLCFIQSQRWATILWCSLEAETPSFLWRNTTLEKGKQIIWWDNPWQIICQLNYWKIELFLRTAGARQLPNLETGRRWNLIRRITKSWPPFSFSGF